MSRIAPFIRSRNWCSHETWQLTAQLRGVSSSFTSNSYSSDSSRRQELSLVKAVNNVIRITEEIVKAKARKQKNEDSSGLLKDRGKRHFLEEKTTEEQGRRIEKKKWSQKEKEFLNAHEATDKVKYRVYLEPKQPTNPKSLAVAIVGRPNAGKSSILNRLLNAKVSAVSPKFNTTRTKVLGIRTREETQICFYDTPGLVDEGERHRYVQPLVTAASEAVYGVDMTMLVVDAVKRLDCESQIAIEGIIRESFQAQAPIMLVLNKIDLARDTTLLKSTAERYNEIIDSVWEKEMNSFQEDNQQEVASVRGRVGEKNCYFVSAMKNKGMDDLGCILESLALEAPWAHHASITSDQSDLELVTEIIREKLYRRFHRELPYALLQENRGWTHFNDGSIRIDQDVLVPTSRNKKAIIGRDGNAIRAVGVAARRDISKLLEKNVHLYLNVRAVKK